MWGSDWPVLNLNGDYLLLAFGREHLLADHPTQRDAKRISAQMPARSIAFEDREIPDMSQKHIQLEP